MWRIGYLALTPGENTSLMKALLERLHELGYSETKNVTFEYRSAEGSPDRLPHLAMELVRANPDVLIAGFGTLAAQAAKAATTTIPIVFTNLGDPVGAGLVRSLGRPGGNVTGLTDQARELPGKRLQILQELVRGAKVIAVLMNPDTPFTALALKEARTAAEAVNLRLKVLEASTADQVPDRFEQAIKLGAVGLLVLEDPLTYSMRRQISELAAKVRLPTIYGYRDFAEAGGLVSYRRRRSRRGHCNCDHQSLALEEVAWVDAFRPGSVGCSSSPRGPGGIPPPRSSLCPTLTLWSFSTSRWPPRWSARPFTARVGSTGRGTRRSTRRGRRFSTEGHRRDKGPSCWQGPGRLYNPG